MSACRVLKGGALWGDRSFYFEDQQGQMVNAKRHAVVQKMRAHYSDDLKTVTLRWSDEPAQRFVLAQAQAELERFVSECFGFEVKLLQASEGGLPDDLEASGPTIVSEASLMEVGRWFSVSLEEVTRRFRPNLVISDCEPFWEDQWLGTDEMTGHVLELGAHRFKAIKACRRCVVPSRSSRSGELHADFVKEFMEKRTQTLHPEAEVTRFTMSYRFGLNTELTEGSSLELIKVGDEVKARGALL
jgi:uncharacterized protein YcbX